MERLTPINLKFIPILLMAIVSMIVIIQYPTALAGACIDNDGDYYWANEACRPNLDPDDGNACIPDPNALACNPVEEIENLIDDVEYLIEEGDTELNNGEITAFLAKLEAAIDKVESDKIGAAINQLNAFINQVNAFISAGSISYDDGQELIYGAQAIIAALNA